MRIGWPMQLFEFWKGRVMRSTLFNLSFYLFTTVVALLCLPLLLVPGRKALAGMLRWWAQRVLGLMKHVGGISVDVHGRENLPNGSPAIIAGKHQSEADGIILLAHVPQLTFIAMKELLEYPIVGAVLRKLQMIMVDTCGGDTQRDLVNKGAAEALKRGDSILIYPEGQLVPAGEKATYKKSIWHMYNNLQVPVIPIATNIGLNWPKRGWTKTPGQGAITVLSPIPPGMDKDEFMDLLETRMETESDRLIALQRSTTPLLDAA